MSRLSVSHESMSEYAGKYITESENVANVISNMDALLASLESEWEGAGSQAYVARYYELKPSFENVQEVIREIGEALQKTSDLYAETDNAVAQAYRG